MPEALARFHQVHGIRGALGAQIVEVKPFLKPSLDGRDHRPLPERREAARAELLAGAGCDDVVPKLGLDLLRPRNDRLEFRRPRDDHLARRLPYGLLARVVNAVLAALRARQGQHVGAGHAGK